MVPAHRPQREPRGEPELSRPWAALSQAPGGSFVQPFLNGQRRLPLMSLEMELCNQLMGKLVPQEQPRTAGVLCNDNIWLFPSFLLFIFY